jgi:hypothetical protein
MAGKKYGNPLAFGSIARDLRASRLRWGNFYDDLSPSYSASNAKHSSAHANAHSSTDSSAPSSGRGAVRPMVYAFIHDAD